MQLRQMKKKSLVGRETKRARTNERSLSRKYLPPKPEKAKTRKRLTVLGVQSLAT